MELFGVKMKRSFFHSLRTYNNSKERLMAENSEAVYAVSARIFKINTTTECGKDESRVKPKT